jgi:hypothetical protein
MRLDSLARLLPQAKSLIERFRRMECGSFSFRECVVSYMDTEVKKLTALARNPQPAGAIF